MSRSQNQSDVLPFALGDLVLCRYSTYPYWPATIDLTHHPTHPSHSAYVCTKPTRRGHSVLCFWCTFCNEPSGGWVPYDRIVRFHPALVSAIVVAPHSELRVMQRRAIRAALRSFSKIAAVVPCPLPTRLPKDFGEHRWASHGEQDDVILSEFHESVPARDVSVVQHPRESHMPITRARKRRRLLDSASSRRHVAVSDVSSVGRCSQSVNAGVVNHNCVVSVASAAVSIAPRLSPDGLHYNVVHTHFSAAPTNSCSRIRVQIAEGTATDIVERTTCVTDPEWETENSSSRLTAALSKVESLSRVLQTKVRERTDARHDLNAAIGAHIKPMLNALQRAGHDLQTCRDDILNELHALARLKIPARMFVQTQRAGLLLKMLGKLSECHRVDELCDRIVVSWRNRAVDAFLRGKCASGDSSK